MLQKAGCGSLMISSHLLSAVAVGSDYRNIEEMELVVNGVMKGKSVTTCPLALHYKVVKCPSQQLKCRAEAALKFRAKREWPKAEVE